MTDIDPITGLPKELSSWENIAKENQQIEVKIEKRKFGKQYTVITGINQHEVNIKDLAKKLKNKFACGGTGKDGVVELQGNHLRNARDELVKLGFPQETIKVTG
jgi:translation initiation factor 1